MQQLISNENVAKFVKAGNALITLQSAKTGAHYTYRVRKAEDGNIHFVSLLTGNDNTSDYTYIGILTRQGFRITGKSRLTAASTPVRAFDFFTKRIDNIPQDLKVYHEGKCCRCGRTLTTPESIEAGIGPECAKYMED